MKHETFSSRGSKVWIACNITKVSNLLKSFFHSCMINQKFFVVNSTKQMIVYFSAIHQKYFLQGFVVYYGSFYFDQSTAEIFKVWNGRSFLSSWFSNWLFFSLVKEWQFKRLSEILYSRVLNSSTGTFINFWELFPPVYCYSSQYVYLF